MTPITDILSLWEEATGVRITLMDLGGIPHGYGLHRNFYIKNRLFCSTVKESGRGLRCCMRCKKLTNEKAAQGALTAVCPFGAEEIVVPLYCRGRIAGLLYLGNFTTDPARSLAKFQKNAPRVGHAGTAEVVQTLAQGHPLAFYRKAADHLASVLTDFLENSPPIVEKIPHAVQNSLLMIKQEFYRPLTLQEVAENCYVNPKYLGRQILQYTGESFKVLLNRKRIDYARSLLVKTDLTVLEIAMRCGFENVTYFNRIFKAHTGCTPTAWRKK